MTNRREERNKQLGESYRQARRETVVIIVAWVVFVIWTGLVCGFGSRLEPGEEIALMFGMPRWAFLGVVLPWGVACLFTFWFSVVFMKDTDLDPDREEREAKEDANREAR